MKKNKIIPIISILGFGFIILTILVNISFKVVSDVGLKIVLSTASALLLFFTTLWGLMGVLEFVLLNQKAFRIKTQYRHKTIDKEEYRIGMRRLIQCFIVNVGYLCSVIFQVWYVIYHWDEINI